MDTLVSKPGIAHRAGSLAGLTLGRFLRFERRMTRRLIGKGVKPVIAKGVFLVLNVCLIGIVLYVSFWIAAALFGIWILRGMAELDLSPDSPLEDDNDNGMRGGLSGFGYYIGEFRVDGARLDEDD